MGFKTNQKENSHKKLCYIKEQRLALAKKVIIMMSKLFQTNL